MTIRDYLDRRTFADEISRNSYYIDIHFTPEEAAAELENGLMMEARGMYYGKGESHGIPYRSLVPRTLCNVLVAGRSISCDRRLLASLRVMPNCCARERRQAWRRRLLRTGWRCACGGYRELRRPG